MLDSDSVLDLLPLYPSETEEAITERWRDWANEGLVPTDPEWTDTRQGSMWWVTTAGGRREAVRIYDLMGSEVIAAAHPLWAWGDYLDDHSYVQDIERLEATPATGEVTFTGPDGQLVATGTVVAVVGPEGDLIEFGVTGDGGSIVGGSITLSVAAVEPGSAGNVGVNAITELVTPLPGVTVTNAEATVGGTDTETDAQLRNRLLDAYVGQGAGNAFDHRRWLSSIPGVGRVTVIPLAFGPGSVLGIITTAAGEPVSGDVLAAAIEAIDPPAFATELLTAVDLPVATINVRSVAGFRDATPSAPARVRIADAELITYEGKVDEANEQQQITVDATGGTFTVTFAGETTGAIPYNATAGQLRDALLALPSVGASDVTVSGGPGGAGGGSPYVVTFVNGLGSTDQPQMTTDATLLTGVGTAVVATLTSGSPGQLTGASGGDGAYAVGVTVAQGGAGRGLAPIGAHVIVRTATGLAVTVDATVEFEDGYSLDGTGAAPALRTPIEDAVQSYVESVESGGEVVLAQVVGRIVGITGVHDAGNVAINGVQGNLAVSSDPAQAPQIAAINLTEGAV